MIKIDLRGQGLTAVVTATRPIRPRHAPHRGFRRRERTAADARGGPARAYGSVSGKVGPRGTWSARILPSRTDSACNSELIMTGEAAARPQKLQKLEQVVHTLDKLTVMAKYLSLGKWRIRTGE